jgi:hypothetical protein
VSKQASEHWPNLQELIDAEGSINIGYIAPLNACAAVAAQQRQVYAQLIARKGEQLTDLLGRLDAAVAKPSKKKSISMRSTAELLASRCSPYAYGDCGVGYRKDKHAFLPWSTDNARVMKSHVHCHRQEIPPGSTLPASIFAHALADRGAISRRHPAAS